LDISAKKGKTRSAPDMDGFSNQLIQKCWTWLRIPFYKYTMHCYEKGIMTHNWRSAKIKLIPKKSDLSNLKNWRPISLLSNFYKILSRAINTRLNKFVNKICSRAQKGYNSKRYAQEVLINVWEQVNYCKRNNLRGAVVAIDMAKAFDMLLHNFLRRVYKFFNFGPGIIKWLDLLGMEREACIAMDSGKTSRFFKLGCGRPQGDNISPNTFNFAVQILIFKLELDPLILTIPRPLSIINNPGTNKESNRETSKNESLADDNTTLTLMDRQSLSEVKTNLANFGDISGLRCNFEKSAVMPTEPPTQEETEIIQQLGYSVMDRIKLLGIEVVYTLDNVEAIFESLISKIVNLVTFWSRFKLTLPGRITLAKTFMVSQLNYIGAFLMPADATLARIQVIINNFVKGGLNISSERMQSDPCTGGVGMFNIKTFLKAQMCCWVSRAYRYQIDNWRYDLKLNSPNNDISLIRPCDVDPEIHPILYKMLIAYRDFYYDFSKVNKNWSEAHIFDNDAFSSGPDPQQSINKALFGNVFYNTHKNQIGSLRFSDCFINNNFKPIDSFHRDGLPLSVATWMRLRGIILHSRQLLTNANQNITGRTSDIRAFLGAEIKGSKRYLDFSIPVLGTWKMCRIWYR
jgi:Reverse transcriptase (RNA-dependent DNA polymerase)